MTFLEIEAFLKIAQCGSFSAAAEKLYITQPALGRRIRALEEELGYSLFIRNKGVRHVELTRQGRAFVGIAHRWQALWNETQEESLLGNEKSFYVASVGSLLAFMLPTVFQEFMKDTPECSLHVTTLHSSDAYGYVNNKTVDIAFITDPMYSSQVKTEILFKEKLCLVVGTELKLPSVYLDEMGFLQYFTQNGDNWAFLPVSVAKSILKSTPVSIHELDVELPNRTLYYLYRAGDESPYQEHLLEICRQKLAGESGITLMEPILNL